MRDRLLNVIASILSDLIVIFRVWWTPPTLLVAATAFWAPFFYRIGETLGFNPLAFTACWSGVNAVAFIGFVLVIRWIDRQAQMHQAAIKVRA